MRALFGSLVLALAAVLVWQWKGWPPAAPGPNAASPVNSAADVSSQPPENPLDLLAPLGEKEEYAVVTERPLFLPERRPPSEEPDEEVAAEPEPSTDLAGLDLNAVLITPKQSSAWIRDPANKEVRRLRPGDELAGWTVQTILADRVLLERQGAQDTLILRDYKNMPPPPPPRRKPVRAKRPRPAPNTQPPDPRQKADRSGQDNTSEQPGGRNPEVGANARQPQRQR